MNKTSFFSRMPRGLGSLFATQLFSTMSFAVLYATLVLYMKEQLHFSEAQSNTIAGVYFAYNFALHLLSGYFGGRLFSYRGLVVTGIFFQLVGCVFLAQGEVDAFYWGLACVLIGTGTLVTCLNMLLSQLFSADEIEKRQTGFLWNYSSMNIGFMLGFTLAGYFQLTVDYHTLFLITAMNNIIACLVLLSRWKYMRDKDTIYQRATRFSQYFRTSVGLLGVLVMIPALYWLLHHTTISGYLVLLSGILVAIFLLVITFHYKGAERHKFLVFFILLISAQIFWITYQLAPMCLTLFAKNNVNLHLFWIQIAPGWIQNINSISIIIGAPLLGVFFAWLRHRAKFPLLGLQYSLGLLISSVGILILPIGIAFSVNGYTAFVWLFFTYIFQAIAELLISPVGCSMIGELIPVRWQSICMGSVLLNSGVAAVLASYFSNSALGATGSHDPLITNPTYAHTFYQLGFITLGVSVILLLLTPWLNRLMRE